MTTASSDAEEPELTPAEWRRRRAKAVEVVAAHITDRAQRMELLAMLGLLPVAADRVA